MLHKGRHFYLHGGVKSGRNRIFLPANPDPTLQLAWSGIDDDIKTVHLTQVKRKIVVFLFNSKFRMAVKIFVSIFFFILIFPFSILLISLFAKLAKFHET